MCSLAIKLWQQNDTVAQIEAAVDVTDTPSSSSPSSSSGLSRNNLITLFINTCRSCTNVTQKDLADETQKVGIKHCYATVQRQSYFCPKEKFISVAFPFFNIYIQPMKRKVSKTKIKCIFNLTHIA